jgi:hypothetical protein
MMVPRSRVTALVAGGLILSTVGSAATRPSI